jgi:hypothetical protein
VAAVTFPEIAARLKELAAETNDPELAELGDDLLAHHERRLLLIAKARANLERWEAR